MCMDSKQLLKQYKDIPCAVCGERTQNYVLYGNTPDFYLLGGEEDQAKQKIIKLCDDCASSRWISTYNR